MAIKVGGTTVIDDSRNFTNIAGGFKTVNGTSVVGSGDISAGASTTFAAVGTYLAAGATGNYSGGETIAGSSLRYNTGTDGQNNCQNVYTAHASYSKSGTWRAMGKSDDYASQGWPSGNLWVRIS